MIIRVGSILSVVGLAHAQVFGELQSCSSVGVTFASLAEDCATLCDPFQASVSDTLNITDTSISQVYKCECGTTDDGCQDEIVLLDNTIPLPTCDANGLDISTVNECKDACAVVKKNVDVFRSVNGKTKCFCRDGWDICSDDPTCTQLRILPGTAADDCADLCGAGVSTTVIDTIEFAGGATNGNKNQTHLNVGCSCNGVQRCRQNILFSDYAFMKRCRLDLEIASGSDCQSYCVANGFKKDFEYLNTDVLGNCTCIADGGEVLACNDLAPPPQGNGEQPGNDDDETSNSAAASVARFVFSIMYGFIALIII